MNEVKELRALAGTLDGVCLPGLAELCERAANRLERIEAENARLTAKITGFIETFAMEESR